MLKLNQNGSPLLDRRSAASYLGVTYSCLSTWASTKRVNLPYYKVGSRSFYKITELDAFLERSKIGGTYHE